MEILVYNESDDTFRSGKVMVLTEAGLVNCEMRPKQPDYVAKQIVVFCPKEKAWPESLRPYVEKVKAEVRAEANPKQLEIRTVLFQPTRTHWACDVYVRGSREFCGQGHRLVSDAISEATAWIIANATKLGKEVGQ